MPVTWFQVLFHSPRRGSFHLSLTVLCAIGSRQVFSLGSWSTRIRTGFLVPRPTQGPHHGVRNGLRIRGCHPLRPCCPARSAVLRPDVSAGHPHAALQPQTCWFGLLPVRSPLLRESLLISSPGLLRWFTSSGMAPPSYFIQTRGGRISPAGLPHSGTRGSKDVCSSPRLFAACRALHRPTAPRHPPWTYSSLDHIVFSSPFLSRSARAAKPALPLASLA